MPSTSDHDFNTEHFIPPVTHCMNITIHAGDYLYSGGEEGGRRVYVSIHDATFDPSTGIKHAANLLRVTRTIIGTNALLFPFNLVCLEIDDNCNHNHKNFRNLLALFGLFLLEKWKIST